MTGHGRGAEGVEGACLTRLIDPVGRGWERAWWLQLSCFTMGHAEERNLAEVRCVKPDFADPKAIFG